MKTLYNYAFPMTDGALSDVDPLEYAEAMINHACRFSGIKEKFRGIPCRVFRELSIGMDLSLSFFLVEIQYQDDSIRIQTIPLTLDDAYRLIHEYMQRSHGMLFGSRPENGGTNAGYRK